MIFFDHHIDAPGFINKNGIDEQAGIGVLGSNPIEGSDDLLVRYGLFDSYDTWLVYGFVDNFAPFVRSVGLHIDLGGRVRIKVKSKIGSRFAGKLPQKLADLKLFMPNVTSVSEGKVEVSHLLIPHPTRPFALKRVLTTLIHAVLPNARPDELRQLVDEANSVVIAENIRFYTILKAFVENLDDEMRDATWHKEVLRLCDLQISKIQAYENHLTISDL